MTYKGTKVDGVCMWQHVKLLTNITVIHQLKDLHCLMDCTYPVKSQLLTM
jgi:hypothetical protein